MNVKLRNGLPPGTSHEGRLCIARRLLSHILKEHGPKIAAVCIYGSTSVDCDGPYSDLDITVLTYPDIGDQTKYYTLAGLSIALDYQTIEESLEEVRDPREGGCWRDIRVLYDPHGEVEKLRAVYQSLTEQDCRDAFVVSMRDLIARDIGKIRNAVLFDDRATLVGAAHYLAEHTCRALCGLNDRAYVTGSVRLFEHTKGLPRVPSNFGPLLDVVSGAVASSDQDLYEAAEDLWANLQALACECGLAWESTDMMI